MDQFFLEKWGWNWRQVHGAIERSDETEIQRLLGNTPVLLYRDKINNTLLHLSARIGNYTLTENYMDRHGIDPNSINYSGETPLMLAAESNQLEIVKLLIEYGANVLCKRNDGQTALHFAIRSNNPAILNLLIDQDKEILNMMDWRGITALHTAVSRESYELVDILISRGIDVDRGLDGYTPLHAALKNKDTLMAKKILAAGAKNVLFEFAQGATALHLAVWMKSVTITRQILDRGADINARDDDGLTALHEAIIASDYDQVALLVARGANLNSKTNTQKTPLHWAAINKDPRSSQNILKLLLSRKCNVNERNHRGSTPLHLVVKLGTVEDLKLMTAAGGDVSILNYFGESVLYSAAANKDPEICRYLIRKNKRNVNRHCILGLYPLHIACKGGHEEVATALIEAGAKINVTCLSGKSPLHYAIYHNRHKIVAILLEHGANINGPKTRDMMLRLAVERRSQVAARIMVKFLARLEAKGVAISPADYKLIAKKEELLELLEQCRAELGAMMERNVVNSVTFFDILINSTRNVLLGYVRNEDFLRNFEGQVHRFPYYEPTLRSNFNWAVHRDRFQRSLSSLMCEVLPVEDPQHLIIQNIVRFLDENDVPNWQKIEEA
ncbi:putative ankyrin repeat protein RF_0381 [Nasonia vitripennis]|uniref:Uncharacterized protein n=1 Tax=Nasonia vitripennis TaxID=7425 RepID=A0A7M7HCT1_NASVI|nr:putative ankyrin repeat protein RF_0381 [Nasonia vitripennis]